MQPYAEQEDETQHLEIPATFGAARGGGNGEDSGRVSRGQQGHRSAVYRKVRGAVATRLSGGQLSFAGEVEVDESYFGGTRKGKRGRGAAGKVAVLGILKRAGKVYTVVPDDLKAKTLMPIIGEKVVPDSIVYTDGFKSYDVLDISEFKHERIDPDQELVDKQGKHINRIENFWNQAKRVLRKYNGIPKHNFELFLKECEFRFNYGSSKHQLKTLKRWLREGGVI